MLLLAFSFLVATTAKSQWSVRDVQAGGYFQIENNNQHELNDWLELPKGPAVVPEFLDPQSQNQGRTNYYSGSSGNASISISLSIINQQQMEKDQKLKPYWRFGMMLVRENDNEFFSDSEANLVSPAEYNSLDFQYTRNMLRTEFQRLWRTDDTRKAFLDFGVGTQFGIAYSSGLDVSELRTYDRFDFYSGESINRSYDAKNAFSTFVYLPVNINVKIVDNLFLELGLRTGLKYLQVFDGLSDIYPVYGIGIGARYVLL